jgi:LssY C-terminus
LSSITHRPPISTVAFALILIHHLPAAGLSSGASVEARLLSPVSSYSSKAGDAIEAVLVRPICFEEDSAVPAGATLRGVLRRVHRVGLGLAHETARLELDFNQLRLPDGETYTVEARLTGVENARERVDQRGAIHGIRATDTLSSRVASRLEFAVRAHPAAIVPSLALETLLFRFPDPEIRYGPGAELRFLVRFPAGFGATLPCAESESLLADESEVQNLLAGLPDWSYSKRQPQPMDLVNLLFLGSLQDLQNAFAIAGWAGSDENSLTSGFHAIQAIAEDREYAAAPMRTLLLEGAPPDLRLQRTLNTFDKRDHLRIWKRVGEWHGAPIWAGAATRDVAATFSMRRPFGFTHRIEHNVDLERDAVVTDLKFTGCVQSAAYAARPPAPAPAETASRRGITSDGRVAIVLLGPCAAELQREETPPLPTPSLETRFIRRVILTARNHFIRDNIVWRSGDALRIAWHAFRQWQSDRISERRPRTTAQALGVSSAVP